jgi:hypothetical protein
MGMIWHYNYFFSALAWTSSRYAQLLVFYATLEKCCLEPYCHFEILLFYVYMAVDMIWHETSASFIWCHGWFLDTCICFLNCDTNLDHVVLE